MHPELREAFAEEMTKARGLYQERKYRECFTHLERAHILGQRHAGPHTLSHWWMLKVGLRTRNGREIFGQIVRLLAGGVGSLVGRVPIGNTGGANVPMLKPMPIAADLQVVFNRAEQSART